MIRGRRCNSFPGSSFFWHCDADISAYCENLACTEQNVIVTLLQCAKNERQN